MTALWPVRLNPTMSRDLREILENPTVAGTLTVGEAADPGIPEESGWEAGDAWEPPAESQG